jgi:hypothetical protein
MKSPKQIVEELNDLKEHIYALGSEYSDAYSSVDDAVDIINKVKEEEE